MALKIACGQIEIIAGRPDLNSKKILHHMDMACQNGIDILLLPELAAPGYFLGDLGEHTDFIEDCAAYGDEIIAATENCGELCVIFGNIAVDNSKRNEDGRARKYNAAFAAQHGKLLTNGTLPYDFIVKNALPNYREFDDNRHFYGLRQLALELDKQVASLHQPLTVTAHGETVKLGLMLCEDGWTENYFLDVPQLLYCLLPGRTDRRPFHVISEIRSDSQLLRTECPDDSERVSGRLCFRRYPPERIRIDSKRNRPNP